MKLDGLDEVLKNLDHYTEEIQDNLEDALTAGAMVGERFAKEYAPVETGTLRRSIAVETEEKNKSAVVVRCGTNVEYAPFLEFGTSRMAAHPFMRPAFFNHKSEILDKIVGELKL